MILTLSDSFRKLFSLRVLAASVAFNRQEPEKTGITKKADPDDSMFVIEITILFMKRPNVTPQYHVGLCRPFVRGNDITARTADPNSGAPAVARHLEAGLRRAHASITKPAKSRS